MGIKRKLGTNQKSKKPILINDLKAIINAMNNSNFTYLRKLRDKSLILIGFAGGFRRSELVNIDIEDIEFVSEGLKIFVKRSKTDQSGEGMTRIPYFINEKYCPVKNLKNWITQGNLKKGKIYDLSDKRSSNYKEICKNSWFKRNKILWTQFKVRICYRYSSIGSRGKRYYVNDRS